MIDKNFFHVALIVPHMETAMEELGAQFGLTWDGIFEADMPLWTTEKGFHEVPLRVTYAPAPFLELIEARPGTPWVLDEHGGSNLHHIGFYTDDLEADAATVGQSFCPIEICSRRGEQYPDLFTYHNNVANGLRVELVQNPRRPQ